MKRIIFASLLMFYATEAFAMEQEVFKHLDHPCLPQSFYELTYAKVLADDQPKEALKTFAASQLQKLATMYQANTMAQDRGELATTRYALYHTSQETTKELMVVQIYGKLVAEMAMHAFRRSLGVTMGLGSMSDEEKRTLRQVSHEEFRKLVVEKYSEDDFERVEHVEQMHAHRMLLDLLEKKK